MERDRLTNLEGQTLTVSDTTTDRYPEGSGLKIEKVRSVPSGTLVVVVGETVGYPTTLYSAGRHKSADLQTSQDVRAEYISV